MSTGPLIPLFLNKLKVKEDKEAFQIMAVVPSEVSLGTFTQRASCAPRTHPSLIYQLLQKHIQIQKAFFLIFVTNSFKLALKA